METNTWDLQESVKHERLLERRVSDSIEKWKDIVENFSTDVTNVTNSGFEWKVRFECQKLYNDMLKKQIHRMRAELRMIRCGVELSPFNQNEAHSIGELRTRIRNLRIEKCSIKSLRNMYERQLDMEAVGYTRARDELEELTKDVANSRLASIRELEKADNDLVTSLDISNGRKRLKPIAKIIPMKLSPAHAKKSTTSYTSIFLQQRGLARAPRESHVPNQESVSDRREIDGNEHN